MEGNNERKKKDKGSSTIRTFNVWRIERIKREKKLASVVHTVFQSLKSEHG